MAVYTKLSEKDLIEFLSKYNIGKIQKHEEIKEGIENTNYLIQTEKGKFILTLYEKRVDEKDLPFFISLMRNLFDKKFPSPEPIINKNGNYISEIFDKKAAVVSKIFCFSSSGFWKVVIACKSTTQNIHSISFWRDTKFVSAPK